MVNKKLFIFGSTGDLVKRKVLLSLHPIKNLEVYGIGRKNLKNEEYADNYCKECSVDFKNNLKYIMLDFDKDLPSDFFTILDKKEINYFYIAMPPENIISILEKIKSVKKKGFKIKILIEKPFGHNLKEAEKIKKDIEKEKLHDEIFLADHYLFKDGVFKINKKFNRIKIVSLEKVGLEGRNYYDPIGALKDMIQSHFMNIILKFISTSEFNNYKIEKFERKQYKNYSSELGKESQTETFVDLKIILKNGKEIEMITGKNMPQKESYVIIDDKKIELNTGEEAYTRMFKEFFEDNKEDFATVENSIFSWKIIEKLEKNKPALEYY